MRWGRVAVGGRPAGVATSASFSGVRWSCDDVLVKEFVEEFMWNSYEDGGIVLKN